MEFLSGLVSTNFYTKTNISTQKGLLAQRKYIVQYVYFVVVRLFIIPFTYCSLYLALGLQNRIVFRMALCLLTITLVTFSPIISHFFYNL